MFFVSHNTEGDNTLVPGIVSMELVRVRCVELPWYTVLHPLHLAGGGVMVTDS